MASYNKVMLMGNLVRDPELRVTPSGLAICRCTIACSRTVRSEKIEGGSREETTFVDVESFGKQAETVAKYFTKGRPIFVEGRLRLNEWQTPNGEKRSKLLVVMETFVFVGPNNGTAYPDLTETTSPSPPRFFTGFNNKTFTFAIIYFSKILHQNGTSSSSLALKGVSASGFDSALS